MKLLQTGCLISNTSTVFASCITEGKIVCSVSERTAVGLQRGRQQWYYAVLERIDNRKLITDWKLDEFMKAMQSENSYQQKLATLHPQKPFQ